MEPSLQPGQDIPQTRASTDAPGDPQSMSELFNNLMQLVSSVSGLALLESRMAMGSLPRYFELAFLKLFMLICIWLSLSGCLMWLVVLASNSVLTGLIAMTSLQVAGYLACKKMQDVHRHRLSLPNTRQQLSQLGDTINESIKAASESVKAATQTGSAN